MTKFSTIFNELLRLIPRNELEKLIDKYKTDRYVKGCTTWNLFVTHLFAQIRGKNSLRDIESSLNSHQSKLHHLGVKKVAKSTISDANNRVNASVFEALFYQFLKRCNHITQGRRFNFENK